MLLTSAGLYGTLLTDITLTIDPRSHRVVGKQADNLIVQGEAFGAVPLTDRYPRFPPSPEVAQLVARYASAVAPLAARPVGWLSAAATRDFSPARETTAGDLIADAQLEATRRPETGGARIAFTNAGGVRADLRPAADGAITFGQLFAAQPFGNTLVVKSLSGRQIRSVLEQQFEAPHSVQAPDVLLVSSSFRYGYDLSRPPGARILDPTLDGAPLDDDASYRVVTNEFLANGGNAYQAFQDGAEPLGGPQELDALEAYFAAPGVRTPPNPDRIRNLTPR
jgi:5'-nucleotidase